MNKSVNFLIGINIHGHGSPARGVNCRPGGGVAGGSKRGSVNFALKNFLRKKGVFKEKNTIFKRFLDFLLQSSDFYIHFY